MRKGTGRAAFVLGTDGDLRPGVVCVRCASRIVQVVTPPPTTIAPACTECGRAPACVCRHCVDALARNVQELAAANTVLRQTSPAAKLAPAIGELLDAASDELERKGGRS